MIKNGKYFSLPDESDDDFKSLFMRVAATGIGRPVDHDGCPQGPWTPELLAEAISQIDANRTGIELRTVQLWFKDNEKGISTSNIRWLARVLGCNDPDGSSAWQVALMRSQARLAARRHSRHRKDGETGTEHVDPPEHIAPEQVQGDVPRPRFDLAHVSEAIFSRGSPLNLPASVFTDDGARVLLGLGASSISRFPQGYAQNAPATGAYTAHVRGGRLPHAKGHAFTPEDLWRGRMIEQVMCDFQINAEEMARDFGLTPAQLQQAFDPLVAQFGNMVQLGPWGLRITPEGRPLARMVANMLDAYMAAPTSHSSAV